MDLVAGPDPGDAAADRLHLPDNVDTEDLLFGRSNPGWPVRTGLAAQGRQVRGIDRYPQHLHQDFTGVGAGWLTSAIRSVSGDPYFS